MPEMNRVLIGSVELDKTKAGKPIVNLYSTDTRLQFPVLRLFDLSALLTVGIDPETLGTERLHRRFWAYYTESEKTTSQGTNYKDVEYLESLDTPATTTSVDSSALLTELRAIRQRLDVIIVAQGLEVPDWAERAEAEQVAALPDNGNGAPEEEPEPLPDNGNGAPDPRPATTETTGPDKATALLDYAAGEGIPAQSLGHLLYGIRKILGDGWEWPVSTDRPEWAKAWEAWRKYHASL